jgi:hypothetical protein
MTDRALNLAAHLLFRLSEWAESRAFRALQRKTPSGGYNEQYGPYVAHRERAGLS